MKILETDRLILRTWVAEDIESILAINNGSKDMEYFPKLQNLEATKKLIIRINSLFKKYSYTVYATESKDSSELTA